MEDDLSPARELRSDATNIFDYVYPWFTTVLRSPFESDKILGFDAEENELEGTGKSDRNVELTEHELQEQERKRLKMERKALRHEKRLKKQEKKLQKALQLQRSGELPQVSFDPDELSPTESSLLSNYEVESIPVEGTFIFPDTRANAVFEANEATTQVTVVPKALYAVESVATSTHDLDCNGFYYEVYGNQHPEEKVVASKSVQTNNLRRNRACQTEDMSRSLFLFTARNPLRKRARILAASKTFSRMLVVGVVVTTLCMLLMDPLQSLEAQRNAPLLLMELAFTAIFLIETLLKVVAFGLLLSEESYLRSPWNILDFACVVSSVVALFSIWFPVYRMFMVVRRFRPLTVIRHFDGLRVRAEASVQTLVKFVGMLSLILMFVVFMGAVGLEFFKGKFRFRCLPPAGESDLLHHQPQHPEDPMLHGWSQLQLAQLQDLPLCGGRDDNCHSDEVCVDIGRNPNEGVTSFDNIGLASLAVFQAMTLEGWTDIQYMIQDSFDFHVGIVYMLVVVVFGALLVMNLALAVLYNSYIQQREAIFARMRIRKEAMRQKKKEEEEEELRQQEKEDRLTSSEAMSNRKLSEDQTDSDANSPAKSRTSEEDKEDEKDVEEEEEVEDVEDEDSKEEEATIRSVFTTMVVSSRFEMFYNVVLFINVVFLAMYSYDASDIVLTMIDWVNMICAILFLIEVIIKISALGVREYFVDPYNQLDFCLVVVSVIEFIFQVAEVEGIGQVALALRALRIVRVAKFAKSWNSMKEFYKMVVTAWGSASNLLGLMFIFMLVFALLGEYFLAGEITDYRFHFNDSVWAVLTVFQIFSGENWNDSLYAGVGAYGWNAAPFYIVLFIVGNTFFLNLLISVLIDSCIQHMEDEDEDDIDALETLNIDADGAPMVLRSGSKLEGNVDKMNLIGNSFCVFSPTNFVRIFFAKVTRSPVFESFILLFIIISTGVLAMDNPHDDNQDTTMIKVFDLLNLILAFVFLGEMMMHMIAMGVWANEGAYLRDGWNVLDALIVCMSFVSLLIPQLVFLRALRAVRSMRIISHNEGLKTVVKSLVGGLKNSRQLFAVGFLLMITFAVIGVNLFAGSFGVCLDHPEVDRRSDCTGSVYNNMTGTFEELEWQQSHRNFNNLANSALILLEISSFEMWPDIMTMGIDSVGMDRAMKENARVWVIVYFVPVVMILAFLYINLFVGVIVQTYQQVKIQDETSKMPPLLRDWFNILSIVKAQKPIKDPTPKQSKFQRFMHSVVTSRQFEGFYLVVIFFVFLVSILQHHGQPEEMTDAFLIAGDVFTYLFALEFLMKIVGLGPGDYFRSGWNRLDFLLVVVTLLPKIFPVLSSFDWIRLLRLLRVVHLARRLPGIGNIIQAVSKGLPQITHALVVTLIIFYMYAVMGMNFFGGVNHEGLEFLTDKANFQTFTNAFLTLIRCATGESYNGIMNDLSWCPNGIGCDYHHAAAPFMVSFVVLSQFLMLNIIMAILIDSYGNIVQKNSVLDLNLVQDFCKLWRQGDPNGTGYLPLVYLHKVLIDLDSPLGLQRTQQEMTVCQLVPYIRHMNLTVYVFQGSETILNLFGETFHKSVIEDLERRSRVTEEMVSGQKRTCRRLSREISSQQLSKSQSKQKDEDALVCCCVDFQDVLQALSARALLQTTKYPHSRGVLQRMHLSLVDLKKSRNDGIDQVSVGNVDEQAPESNNSSSRTPKTSGSTSNSHHKSVEKENASWTSGTRGFLSQLGSLKATFLSGPISSSRPKPDFQLEDLDAASWMAVHSIEIHWIARSLRRDLLRLIAEAKLASKLAAGEVQNSQHRERRRF